MVPPSETSSTCSTSRTEHEFAGRPWRRHPQGCRRQVVLWAARINPSPFALRKPPRGELFTRARLPLENRSFFVALGVRGGITALRVRDASRVDGGQR